MAVQARIGRDKLESVTSEVNHSIEGTVHKDQPGKPNVEMKGSLSRARRDRNRTAVAKGKNKEFIGNADQVQENMDEAKIGKGKTVHGKLDMYLLPFIR